MTKSKFLLCVFIFLSLFSINSHAQTGYGSTPVYEEYYEEQVYEETPPSYGGGGGGGGGGYGSTPVYEEEYEEEKPPEEKYEEEVYEETPPPVYGGGGGGYGSTPVYEEYYAEKPEYEMEIYEETGIYYGETPPPGKPPKGPKYPPSYKTGFIVDIHFLAGDPNFQYIAYHYCQELYTGFSQCDIYNGTKEKSKFMATEIVVSAEIFQTLPMAERKLWHSHAFAVKSGLLVLPTLPPDQDLETMASVINTYGKITDFWHSYQSFPYGGAKLAYGLGADSQIIPELARQMDQELGLSTTWQERREQRKNLKAAPKIEGADDYLVSGQYPQYVVRMFDVQSIGIAEEGGAGENGENGAAEEDVNIVIEEEEAVGEGVAEESVSEETSNEE